MTIKVDLLDRPGRRMGFDPIIFFLVIVIVIFTVGFVVYGQSLEKKKQAKKDEIAKIEADISNLRDKIPKIKELEEANADLQRQIDTIKELVYDPVRYANLLDEIAAIMPKSIFIQNLTIEPTNLSMTFSGLSVEIGGARPLDSISVFMQSINNSKLFKDASLASTNLTEYEGRRAYGFQIETKYDPDATAQ